MKFRTGPRLTLHRDEAAHAPHKSLRNGQAKPDTSLFPVPPGINLTEAGKNSLHILLPHTDPGIFDTEHQIDAIFLSPASDPQDNAPFPRELDGIFQQIHDDAPQLLLIAQQIIRQIGITIHDQFHLLAVFQRHCHIDDIRNGGGNIVALLRQIHPSALQFRKIKDIADRREKISSCRLYIYDITSHIHRDILLQNSLAHPAHRIDRRADLMGNIYHEIVLAFLHNLQFPDLLDQFFIGLLSGPYGNPGNQRNAIG